MQIPRFIHEQNAIPGQTNRLLSRFASRVFITLEESARYFPTETTLLTGNPLRRQILEMVAKANPPQPFIKEGGQIPPFQGEGRGGDAVLNLFVFGGSQGAHAVNMAMVAALPYLKQSQVKLNIVHQTGENDCAVVADGYRGAGVEARITPFISDMAAEYAQADLIICRAGATTIAEVTACGKTCLFIPFPHAVDDHQRKNAEALLKKDACFMMLERELTGESLAQTISSLADGPGLIRKTGELAFGMARLDAARIVVDEMIDGLPKSRSGGC